MKRVSLTTHVRADVVVGFVLVLLVAAFLAYQALYAPAVPPIDHGLSSVANPVVPLAAAESNVVSRQRANWKSIALSEVAPELGGNDPGRSRVAVQSNKEVVEAISAFESGDVARALEHFRAAARQQPQLPPPGVMLARLYRLQGQTDAQEQTLREAQAKSSDHPSVNLDLSEVLLLGGKYAQASLHADKALATPLPEGWGAVQRAYVQGRGHSLRAGIFESRGEWPQAETALRRWLEVQPKSGDAKYRLAKVSMIQGRPIMEVYELLKEAAKYDSTRLPAEMLLANLFQEFGDDSACGYWLREAVENHPGDARTYFERAFWEMNHGHPVVARDMARQATELGLDHRDVQFLRGLIDRQLGDYAKAERWFQRVAASDPHDLEAATQLAAVLVESKKEVKRTQALVLAESAAERWPDNPDVMATLGWVYFRLGRLADAEQVLREAANKVLTPETAFFLAKVLAEQGRAAEIRPLLESATKTPGRFLFRDEATRWLGRLGAEMPVGGSP